MRNNGGKGRVRRPVPIIKRCRAFLREPVPPVHRAALPRALRGRPGRACRTSSVHDRAFALAEVVLTSGLEVVSSIFPQVTGRAARRGIACHPRRIAGIPGRRRACDRVCAAARLPAPQLPRQHSAVGVDAGKVREPGRKPALRCRRLRAPALVLVLELLNARRPGFLLSPAMRRRRDRRGLPAPT